ncbi:uncharacterized protein [Musca autumnalis]|uniref:uncharacterized protein n=1 Tax=Musca autumnalis TaxID=221902 RepID=UPI003CEF38C6
MKVFIFCMSLFLEQCYAAAFLHNIHERSMHSTFYDHDLHEEIQNSPVININNYQNVHQESTTSVGGHHLNRDNFNYDDGYSNHHSMKQESYYRRHPKLGKHHNSNMFGNTSSMASSSASVISAGSSSPASGRGGYKEDPYYGRPWRY